MKYATIDKNGIPTAFYSDDVHDNIPKAAIEISDSDWQAHINGMHRQWDGKTWVAYTPPPPTLTEAKASKLAEINAIFDKNMTQLVSTYPEREVESWPYQEREARAYLINPAVKTPLLDALVAVRGVTKNDLATKIVTKADQFAVVAGRLIGKRQALEDAITTAQTVSDVEAITW